MSSQNYLRTDDQSLEDELLNPTSLQVLNKVRTQDGTEPNSMKNMNNKRPILKNPRIPGLKLPQIPRVNES